MPSEENPMRLLIALACAFAAQAVAAAELKVLSAGALKPVLVALQPAFEQQTGHRLRIENDTAGGLQKRIAAGEAFDLVFSSPASLRPLREQGRLAADEPVPIARVAIGVAVRKGAPAPDISSVAAFRSALLRARSVAYIDPAAGGSSGVYLDQLFERWGIAPQVRAKAVLVQGGQSARQVVAGRAVLAMQQISELVSVPGVVLVGPLPPEIQKYTVYTGAVSAGSVEPGTAHAFLQALRGPTALEMLKKLGMQSP
jgi:molybdate transport system substrate-binding protein